MKEIDNFEAESKKIEFGLTDEMKFSDLTDDEKIEIFGNTYLTENDFIDSYKLIR